MERIIIDTNALLAITEWGVDIFTELQQCCDFNYSLAVLQGTIEELEKVKQEQRLRYKQAAKLALALIERKKIAIIPGKGHVDDLLVQHSLAGDYVLTQDVALKKRLHKPYLTIRQKKKIILVRSLG